MYQTEVSIFVYNVYYIYLVTFLYLYVTQRFELLQRGKALYKYVLLLLTFGIRVSGTLHATNSCGSVYIFLELNKSFFN